MFKNFPTHLANAIVLLLFPTIIAIWYQGAYTPPKPQEPTPPVAEQTAQESQDHNEMAHLDAYILYANPRLTSADRQVMAKAIVDNSKKYSLPIGLVVAVIHAESNFNAKAIGPQTKYGSAMGPMQLMWPMHKDLANSIGVDQKGILTAAGGVKAGCFLLSRYITAEKSITGGLIRFLSQPNPKYVLDKVLASYLTYKQISIGLVELDKIEEAHQKEIASMKRLTKKGP